MTQWVECLKQLGIRVTENKIYLLIYKNKSMHLQGKTLSLEFETEYLKIWQSYKEHLLIFENNMEIQ